MSLSGSADLFIIELTFSLNFSRQHPTQATFDELTELQYFMHSYIKIKLAQRISLNLSVYCTTCLSLLICCRMSVVKNATRKNHYCLDEYFYAVSSRK